MVNYRPFVKWHAQCEEASGALVDAVAALNFTVQNGVGSRSDGIILQARSMPDSNDGFQRSVGIAEPFDFTAQGVGKGTFMGWANLDSAGGNQVFAEQTGATENEKAWSFSANRIVSTKPGALIAFRDNAGADWDWAFQIPNGGLDVAYPTGEWVFIGFSWSIPDDRTSGWLYTQTAGLHYESFTGAAAFGAPFNYTTRGVTHIGAHQSAGDFGGSFLGDADHITMLHGIEFQQKDVDFFWRNGRARIYPRQFAPLIGANPVLLRPR